MNHCLRRVGFWVADLTQISRNCCVCAGLRRRQDRRLRQRVHAVHAARGLPALRHGLEDGPRLLEGGVEGGPAGAPPGIWDASLARRGKDMIVMLLLLWLFLGGVGVVVLLLIRDSSLSRRG